MAANHGNRPSIQVAMEEIRCLQKKVTTMEKERAEQNVDSYDESLIESQPLRQSLWDSKVPDNFKSPHLPTFYGKTDPVEHLMAVGTQTPIIGALEHLRYKLLSGTLKDAALRWYMNLPNNSIKSYADFHKKFIHKFSGTKHVKVTATRLFTIRQNYAETLREYLARFSEETMTVSNQNHEMFVAAFHNRLKAGHFDESLAQNPATSMQEVIKRASCYIKGEESNAEKRSREAKEKDSRSSNSKVQNSQPQQNWKNHDTHKQGYRAKPYHPPNSAGGMGYPHYSSTDILYWDAYKAMHLSDEQLNPYSGTLVGFAGEQIDVMGHITLYTTFGEDENAKTIKVRYLVVKTLFTSYNIIIGRPAFNTLGAVMSTLYLSIKYPLNNDYPSLEQVQIGEHSHQTTNIGTSLQPEERERIVTLLRNNRDLFAWQPSDMPEIDESVITHKLSILPVNKPVVQRKRKVGKERRAAITEEKASGKWRMCVDFTDLNKACPKDPYPLPNIDRLIDGASGYKTLSFMDVYSGYNQIKMHPMDAQHTTFMSNTCNYFYNVMPFGLKNAGATYQRLMDRVFVKQIGKNLEVYIDDMVVKTQKEGKHDKDLEDILKSVRKYNMRLNPAKCYFGVQAATNGADSSTFQIFILFRREGLPFLRHVKKEREIYMES
ncbi:hypothetical protein TSUD_367500 [Trifolium subterraneum]|uniref:Reverse transcriptase domain-containing protein n=1 Tax=Trifolium subterraneum TaxID=3900 RepID=A0A2Z6PBH8_TRISU|nr:hypothetical protein TSUD_367500 [Trifolium subterraneum]